VDGGERHWPVPVPTTEWRDSLVVLCDSIEAKNMVPVLITMPPSVWPVGIPVFNGATHQAINRMIRDASDIGNWPCLDAFWMFMDAGRRLQATRPAEFPNDSTSIFGHGTTPDSGLVKFSDKVHLTSACNGCPGGGSGRNMSTRGLTQTSGHALLNVGLFQAVDFLRQIGEPSN
jgi:hypothetical protein